MSEQQSTEPTATALQLETLEQIVFYGHAGLPMPADIEMMTHSDGGMRHLTLRFHRDSAAVDAWADLLALSDRTHQNIKSGGEPFSSYRRGRTGYDTPVWLGWEWVEVVTFLDPLPEPHPGAGCRGCVGGGMSLDDLSPSTRDLIAHTEAALPSQQSDEFTRLGESILDVQVCTSLTDEEATARVNLLPPGTSYGWQLTTDLDLGPVPCQDRPQTHRHLLFEC